MPHIILHVGSHKTATTTIQQHIARHRDKFAARGLIYPAMRLRTGEKAGHHSWIAKAITGCYPEFVEALDAWRTIRDTAADTDTILLSMEDACACVTGRRMWRGLNEPDWELRRQHYLVALAREFSGCTVEVVMFLRRVDAYAQSLFSTIIRNNRFNGSFDQFIAYAEPVFDYQRQLVLWQQSFQACRALPFASLQDSPIRGFLSAIGFKGPVRGAEKSQRRNVSPDNRLVLWMADQNHPSDPPALVLRRRHFIASQATKSLFVGYPVSTLWSDDKTRRDFRLKHERGFRPDFFGDRAPIGEVPAVLSEQANQAISALFARWQQWPGTGRRSAILVGLK